MSDEKTPQISRAFRDNPAAPIIYFDGVAAHGVIYGAIQIEVISRTLIPLEDGSATNELLVTGRLRCSPTAAQALIDALQKSIEMLKMPQPRPSAGTATLN
jgi:hypothetical protein